MTCPSFPDVRIPLWMLFTFYLPLKAVGQENIPSEGPFVLCSNHASYLDPIVLGYSSVRRQVGFMAKEELFRVPVFGSLIRHWGAFPVRRNQRDESAVRAFHDFLHRNKPLVLFPEGTRSHDGELQVPKKGSGKLLYHARVPVLPVYLHGAYEAWSRHRKFPRPGRLKAFFGRPLSLDDLYALPDEKETYRRIAERVMDGIRDLKTAHVGSPP